MSPNQSPNQTGPQTPEWQFMVMAALKEPRRSYCTTIHKGGRFHAVLDWGKIDRIYGCAVFKGLGYERRIMILPGAAVYVVRDRDDSWCFTAETLAVIEDVMSGLYLLYTFRDFQGAEKVKEVCAEI